MPAKTLPYLALPVCVKSVLMKVTASLVTMAAPCQKLMQELNALVSASGSSSSHKELLERLVIYLCALIFFLR